MAEAQIWKAKYTTEAVARIEDLENARAKLLVKFFVGTLQTDYHETSVSFPNGSMRRETPMKF
jgi:hypothetical protein